YNLFEIDELTSNQKSILLLIHENCNSLLRCELTTSELSSKCGLALNTITSLVNSLVLKGYLVRDVYEDPLNDILVKYIQLTDKIKWPSQIHILSDCLKADISQTPNANAILDMVMKMVRSGKLEVQGKQL
ncbi:MAG TPA: hypothetical protein VGD31_03735, partial [Sphingobacteriaceae bacterium]